MLISEYRNIDNKLNTLINSVDKIIQLKVTDTNDLEFTKYKKTIVTILKKLFDDNKTAKYYIVKFNQIINHDYKQKEVNFSKTKNSLKQLIYDTIEEMNRVYNRNLNFISNCSLPHITFLKALKLYKIFSRKLVTKKKITSELFS